MRISRSVLIVGVAASLSWFGCKKSDSGATPTVASTGSAAMAGSAAGSAGSAAPAPATAPATAGSAAAGSATGGPAVTIATDDEFLGKSTAMLDQLSGIFTGAGSNCDQLTDALVKFVGQNGATVKGLDAYAKAHPDVAKTFETTNKPKVDTFEAAAEKSATACKDNKNFADAMTKMAGASD